MNLDKEKIEISLVKEEEIDEMLDLKYQYFKQFYSLKKDHHEYALNKLDLNWSLVAKYEDRIIGGYILQETKLPIFFDNFYHFPKGDYKGVEGVSLFVDEEYKGNSIGKMLMEYYKDSDLDFIWGQAFHSLNNIEHWLKRRILFNDKYGVYYTIEFYNEQLKESVKTNFFKKFYEEYSVSFSDHIVSQIENLHIDFSSLNEENLNDYINLIFNKTQLSEVFETPKIGEYYLQEYSSFNRDLGRKLSKIYS